MPGKIRTALKVDLEKPAWEQPYLHNRWHHDIPFCGKIKDGETVKIECLDWTGGQIKNDDSADDVRDIDLTRVHYLSGPFEIENAEPGDVLLVEIMDVQPFQDHPWGFTGVFHKDNGGGFLDEIYPDAAKAIWDFEGIHCTSRHIPGVKFAGLIHPGILGCAPSPEILAEWNKREAELINTSALQRVVALPPLEQSVHAGSASNDVKSKVGKEELVQSLADQNMAATATSKTCLEAARCICQSTSRERNSASATSTSPKEMGRYHLVGKALYTPHFTR